MRGAVLGGKPRGLGDQIGVELGQARFQLLALARQSLEFRRSGKFTQGTGDALITPGITPVAGPDGIIARLGQCLRAQLPSKLHGTGLMNAARERIELLQIRHQRFDSAHLIQNGRISLLDLSRSLRASTQNVGRKRAQFRHQMCGFSRQGFLESCDRRLRLGQIRAAQMAVQLRANGLQIRLSLLELVDGRSGENLLGQTRRIGIEPHHQIMHGTGRARGE